MKKQSIGTLLVSLLLIATGGTTQGQVSEQRRILTCLSTFHPNTNHDELARGFGAANVTTGSVHLGEGEYEEGTVLFADTPEDKVEILWKDRDLKRFPRSVGIRGEKSRWHTRQGLTLGMHLHTIEKLNRRPFRLRGFDWDYEGTVMSWSGGIEFAIERIRNSLSSFRVTPTLTGVKSWPRNSESVTKFNLLSIQAKSVPWSRSVKSTPMSNGIG